MKKRVLVFLIIPILVVILFLYIINPFFIRYYYTHITYKTYEKYMNLFPKNEGIRIICTENGKIDCTEKTTFKCGEKIELFVTIKNVITPFYACVNLSFFNMGFVCSKKTFTPFFFYEPNLTVPKMNGKVRFIEIYWFPPKDYNEIADFLKDINSSKKIMNIDKEIIC